MDLSNMTAAHLRDLQKQVERELKKRETEDKDKAREKIFAIAQSLGVPVKELIGNGVRVKGAAGARAKTGTVAARYRNPADSAQLWTGRGRQPKWVKEWLDAGKPIDGLRI
ncbi:MAG: H-NS histone family protein [Pseudomonadota bacterium]